MNFTTIKKSSNVAIEEDDEKKNGEILVMEVKGKWSAREGL
jgi:hypothetical protein